MLFNSLDFAIFLPIVFICYWFLISKDLKLQNVFLLLSSYVFYGWWDWRFLFLILISTLSDYFIGLWLGRTDRKNKRKVLLWTSILINIGILGFFKYFNFFQENFVQAFQFLGYHPSAFSLNIILPVGISFYTFQTLSYTIDIYKGKFDPTKDFIAFAAFVSFFPQLVAGPIERANHLLPQFFSKRSFDYALAVNGLRQILWGLFKKIVIADNCAVLVNDIFLNPSAHSSSALVMGAILFSFQIYGDFSGYSDIAIGTSRLFGFDLKRNFAFPYFSRDIAEFWRRWHISLSSWFRDYLYIPLGGSKGSWSQKFRNTMVIFLVSGFWHGANWTFLVWGFLNAFYFLPMLLTRTHRKNLNIIGQDGTSPPFQEILSLIGTFLLVSFSWIFFRSENLSSAFIYLNGILDSSFFSFPFILESGTGQKILPKTIFILLLIFVAIEWTGRRNKFAIERLPWYSNLVLKYSFYYAIILMIGFMGAESQEFIYFQF